MTVLLWIQKGHSQISLVSSSPSYDTLGVEMFMGKGLFGGRSKVTKR